MAVEASEESATGHAAGCAVQDLPSLAKIAADLSDKNVSIVVKMSHLFSLREHGGREAAELLVRALKDRATVDSVLFRHEAAYVLGQLGSPESISFLEDTLADMTEDELVRHEAAEALAAIGSDTSLTTLSAYLEDASHPVKQTCELAVRSLKYKQQQRQQRSTQNNETEDGVVATSPEKLTSSFNTVDPSAPFEGCTAADVSRLFAMLMDSQEPLWTRYRALLTLRDLRVPAAAAAIARCLLRDRSSALLRHEVAFVLGQIQFPSSVSCPSKTACAAGQLENRLPHAGTRSTGGAAACSVPSPPETMSAEAAACEAADALLTCLADPAEHCMARHEAALALGSLGVDPRSATCELEGERIMREAIVTALLRYRTCSDQVVAESCVVALSNMQEELGISYGV
ncbi:deoxyhypusine hydroxylase [Cyclospora cayetanensis]|uniref:Deoxyhypusine hydroxylase n=1 Tax=Cyclospora cayetanensis TaxID=88456 RepID=A0A6P6RZU1_9EIME|nr:deoxyhypusine hydroxylase [Cyclospora cayetanensis]